MLTIPYKKLLPVKNFQTGPSWRPFLKIPTDVISVIEEDPKIVKMILLFCVAWNVKGNSTN